MPPQLAARPRRDFYTNSAIAAPRQLPNSESFRHSQEVPMVLKTHFAGLRDGHDSSASRPSLDFARALDDHASRPPSLSSRPHALDYYVDILGGRLMNFASPQPISITMISSTGQAVS